VEREFSFLRELETRLCQAISPTHHAPPQQADALGWARPLRKICDGSQTLHEFEFIPGETMSRLLAPHRYSFSRFQSLLARLVQGYVDLCQQVPAQPRGATLTALADSLGRADAPDSGVQQRIGAACNGLRHRSWQPMLTHGDLIVNNVIVTPANRLVLVDWESATWTGLPALDLVRLLYDLSLDSASLKRPARTRLLAAAREIIRSGLARLNVKPADYADLEVLFVADQLELSSSRNAGGTDILLSAYDRGDFALDQ
jgi:hypothetical protein